MVTLAIKKNLLYQFDDSVFLNIYISNNLPEFEAVKPEGIANLS